MSTLTNDRLPIKTRPLRSPGDSLRERIDAILEDRVLLWVMFPVTGALFTLSEWVHYVFRAPPRPWTATICTLIALLACVYRLRRIRAEVRQLRLGLLGEKSVGQALEALRDRGYRVIHDIPGDGYNIDHVLIGPTGVYAIETKTRMKPTSGAGEVIYDGERVMVNGLAPDRDPLVQARAAARDVKRLILESTGRSIDVRPVVIFPGWYIRRTCRRPEVWVVNEKYLEAWLERDDDRLTPEEVRIFETAIAAYVRAAVQR